ncbi:unnamed protein product [Alternaria alternata]
MSRTALSTAPAWLRQLHALLSVRPAVLHAHQRRHVEGAHYPVVILSADECERIGVKVRAQKSKGRASDAEHRDVQGDEVSAQTYAWITREHRFECREWDFDHFVKEEISRGVGVEVARGQGKASINGGLWWTIGMFADIGQMLLMPLLHWTILPVGEVSMATFSRQFESGGQAEEKVPGGAV